ncbi:MAG: hypothetical protein KAT31_09870 [Bacteroidales bacterium]|nr:hypothetical protein [Bacteroidales bacterium]
MACSLAHLILACRLKYLIPATISKSINTNPGTINLGLLNNLANLPDGFLLSGISDILVLPSGSALAVSLSLLIYHARNKAIGSPQSRTIRIMILTFSFTLKCSIKYSTSSIITHAPLTKITIVWMTGFEMIF